MDKKDISLMDISKIIVHDVPRHKKNDSAPQIDYSEKESSLTPELKTFFKDRLTEIINKQSFKVIYDATTISPVPQVIRGLNNSLPRKDIVLPSKDLAKYLYDIQGGNNPAGIIVIIEGMIMDKNVVSIMKLERDEGAQLRKHTKDHFTDIVFIKELILTKKTKLYKASLFFSRLDFSCDFDGYVTDNQVLPTSHLGVASFFIHDFLGCSFYNDTRRMTKQFFELTRDFILTVEDPLKKAKYYEHLLSYSNRPKKTIDPREFIRDFFEGAEKQGYEDFMTRNDFDMTSFVKDTELIESHLKHILIDFDNDVQIIARNGDLGNRVVLTDQGNGLTKAEVISRIKRISS